jgi:hypothetical protein
MEKKNFLLGKGEKLTRHVTKKNGPGEKNFPYSFGLAKQRVIQKVLSACSYLDSLGEDASPDGKVVANVVIHPRFISKSDFPKELFQETGLTAVGGFSKYVKPEQWGIEKPPEGAVTDTLFVSTSRQALRALATTIDSWQPNIKAHVQLQTIEDFVVPSGESKVKGVHEETSSGLFEVILHGGSNEIILKSFYSFLATLNAEPITNKVRFSAGITFIPVRGNNISE